MSGSAEWTQAICAIVSFAATSGAFFYDRASRRSDREAEQRMAREITAFDTLHHAKRWLGHLDEGIRDLPKKIDWTIGNEATNLFAGQIRRALGSDQFHIFMSARQILPLGRPGKALYTAIVESEDMTTKWESCSYDSRGDLYPKVLQTLKDIRPPLAAAVVGMQHIVDVAIREYRK